MTHDEILEHLRFRVPMYGPMDRGAVQMIISAIGGGGGPGQMILDAIRELIGTVGLDVEVVVAAAKQYYDQLVAPDLPNVPNFLESFLESLAWAGIERAIRKMFAP